MDTQEDDVRELFVRYLTFLDHAKGAILSRVPNETCRRWFLQSHVQLDFGCFCQRVSQLQQRPADYWRFRDMLLRGFIQFRV